MTYKGNGFYTKSGKYVSEEEIEKLANMAERGELKLGEWLIKPPGRPPLSQSEELAIIAFKVPQSQRDKLDQKAENEKLTRSQLMRQILSQALS